MLLLAQGRLLKTTIFVVIIGFIIFSTIGLYINPLIISIYQEAKVDAPDKVYNYIRYSGSIWVGFWFVWCCITIIKDYIFKRRLSFYINMVFLFLLICTVVYYPVAIDLIHLPIINN